MQRNSDYNKLKKLNDHIDLVKQIIDKIQNNIDKCIGKII